MRFIWAIIVFFVFPSVVFADLSTTEYPELPCDSEIIHCELAVPSEIDTCKQYRQDSSYKIVGGYMGASFGKLSLCKKTDTPVVENSFARARQYLFFSSLLLISSIGGILFVILFSKKI